MKLLGYIRDVEFKEPFLNVRSYQINFLVLYNIVVVVFVCAVCCSDCHTYPEYVVCIGYLFLILYCYYYMCLREACMHELHILKSVALCGTPVLNCRCCISEGCLSFALLCM